MSRLQKSAFIAYIYAPNSIKNNLCVRKKAARISFINLDHSMLKDYERPIYIVS